jgi:hypothetical protein
MKKILVMLVALIFSASITGCEYFDGAKCMATVQRAYPNGIVWRLPDIDYRFVVLDSGRVIYVRTVDTWDKISSINIIKQ